MTLIDRIRAAGRAFRAPAEARNMGMAMDGIFGSYSAGGVMVDPEQASRHTVALRCIQVQSENLASVPLNLYRRGEDGGRELAEDHPTFAVLTERPAEGWTAFDAREFLIASVLTYGNAYARLDFNGRGQVTALTPLDPRAVIVERLRSGRIRYRVSDAAGSYVLTAEEVLHLRYRRRRDGVMGLSPLQHAAGTVDLAMAQQETAQTQARNAFRPAGALVFPEAIGNERARHALDNLSQTLVGAEKAGKLMVLDGGVKFEPFAINSRDAEFLESRKLSNLDIARIYGVPPTVAGIPDYATYSNVEQESRALVARCLSPLARRIEQAMTDALLPAGARSRLYIEHDLSGLLRGDQKARFEAYRIGREWGWLSQNEIRRLENLPAIEGGDEYLTPLNMSAGAASEPGN